MIKVRCRDCGAELKGPEFWCRCSGGTDTERLVVIQRTDPETDPLDSIEREIDLVTKELTAWPEQRLANALGCLVKVVRGMKR